MNKKFSTLMAAALLAGSLPVVAQTTTEWVPVTPAQLVNGAEYVIHKGDHSYSVIEGTAGNKSGMPYTDGQNCPLFGIPKADSDSIWTLTKVEGGFTLKSDAENLFTIYLANKGLYTNVSNPDLAVFTLGNDSTLSVTIDGVANYVVAPSKKNGTTGFMVDENKENALKFAFFMKQDFPSDVTDDVIVEDAPSTATTMYVIVNGEYVTLDAEGTDVSSEEKPGDNNASVWVYDGDKLRSYAGNKYLKIEDKLSKAVDLPGDLQLTVTDNIDDAATVSISGQVVSFGGVVTDAALVNTNKPLPFEGSVGSLAEDGATSIVLLHNGNAYSAEDGFVAYNPNNSAATVWTLVAVETTKGQYEIRLKNDGKYLVVKDAKGKEQYVTVEYVTYNSETGEYTYTNSGKVLLMAGDDYVYVAADETLAAVDQINQANTFGLGQIDVAHISAKELISRYGSHFTLGVTYYDNDLEKDVDVTGVFSGNLRPCKVSYVNGQATYNYNVASLNDSYMLVKDGNIIAIDLDKPLLAGRDDYGYALTTITPKEYALNKTKYAVWFKMEYTPGQAEGDVKAITKIELGREYEHDNNYPHYYYTIGLQQDSNDDIVLVAASEGYLLDDYTISIALNAGSVVDATKWLTKPVYYTVKSINKEGYGRFAGKVLGLNEYGNTVDFVAAENIDLTQPEGQFAIINDGAYFKFTNRETGKEYNGIYAANLYQIDATTFAYVNGTSTPDTLSIEPVSNYSSEDGFKRFSPAELNANTYTVSMKLFNGNLLNIIENHTDKHRIGLDEEDATEWRIEMPTVKILDATKDVIRLAADTLKRETRIYFYVDGKRKETQIENPEKDYYYPNTELQICTYVLKNTDNNEYLDGKDYTESAGNAYYVCNEDKTTATRIAFKKVGETVRLVPVKGYYDWWDSYVFYDTDKWIKDFFKEYENSYKSEYARYLDFTGRKIIGGTTAESGVLKDEPLYKATSNDLFVINVAEAPTYKKMEQGDKIILSLKNNTENVLVEGPIGSLATISNREAHKDLNPTLYVDTAYVNRVGNYAYQYLLGVRINRVDTTYECNVPAHGTHRADTTFGYFLVNMIDSAKACTDVHNNKFEYNGEHKLDFVKGYRTNDTLFFTNDADKVISSMKVGDASYNIAKFAFKMIDEEENEFVIETGDGYDKQVIEKDGKKTTVTNVVTTPSYLRWVNGNLVVTSKIDNAAHFTMEVSDKEATANETIAAGNVVVAGTNGAVVVKGAEGKNVIVSTILGKVVANEVLTSDNAQISAPAGIVVVSVDGESFKVVVK